MHHMETTSDLFPSSKSVRMTVPVPPHVRDAFQRLAAAQGCSVGKAMGDWMTDTVEGVEAMADMLERARQQPRKAISSVHVYATSMQNVVDSVIVALRGDVLPQGAPAPGEGASLGGGAAPGAGAPRPLTPPVGNTGGKVPRKVAKGRGGNP